MQNPAGTNDAFNASEGNGEEVGCRGKVERDQKRKKTNLSRLGLYSPQRSCEWGRDGIVSKNNNKNTGTNKTILAANSREKRASSRVDLRDRWSPFFILAHLLYVCSFRLSLICLDVLFSLPPCHAEVQVGGGFQGRHAQCSGLQGTDVIMS